MAAASGPATQTDEPEQIAEGEQREHNPQRIQMHAPTDQIRRQDIVCK
jgi:hypothetical protein